MIGRAAGSAQGGVPGARQRVAGRGRRRRTDGGGGASAQAPLRRTPVSSSRAHVLTEALVPFLASLLPCFLASLLACFLLLLLLLLLVLFWLWVIGGADRP